MDIDKRKGLDLGNETDALLGKFRETLFRNGKNEGGYLNAAAAVAANELLYFYSNVRGWGNRRLADDDWLDVAAELRNKGNALARDGDAFVNAVGRRMRAAADHILLIAEHSLGSERVASAVSREQIMTDNALNEKEAMFAKGVLRDVKNARSDAFVKYVRGKSRISVADVGDMFEEQANVIPQAQKSEKIKDFVMAVGDMDSADVVMEKHAATMS